MAWAYEQTFDSYTDGDLNGQDSWTGSTSYDVQTSVVNQGTKAISHDLSVDASVYRDITGVASGTVYVWGRSTATNKAWAFYLMEGASTPIYVDVTGGNLQAYDIDHYETIGTFSANTWYRVGIAFECGAGGHEGLSADTFKVNINGGVWSDAKGFAAAAASISRVRLASQDAGASGTSYWDYIGPNYDPPSGGGAVVIQSNLLLMGAG